MIVGIGVDTVQVHRFAHFIDHKTNTLARLFSPEEIAYCSASKTHAAHRFAARFAAREASYKALTKQPPFLTWCRSVAVIHRQGKPHLAYNSDLLKRYEIDMTGLMILLSLSHTKETACAFVVIEHTKNS